MWLVRLALKRPYTFVVMAVLILLLGIGSALKTPTDIFPDIGIPVVSVIWTYDGLSASEMEKRMTVYSEYAISANVNNIKRIESQTLNGVAVIKVYFHPNAKIETGLSQITAVSQAILRRMPPGVNPPIILKFNASSVPIVQMALSSKTLSESQVYDYGIFRIRQQLAVVQGVTLPAPFGGKVRQISIDIDPQKLLSFGLSPQDINNAINAQNLTLPTGQAKVGKREYTVSMNSSPESIAEFNEIPIKVVGGTTIYMRDVASIRDGFEIQRNIVRQDGSRGVLLTIIKGEGASTVEIVNKIKELLPTMQAAAPAGLNIELLSDQSIFVRAAVNGVLKESLIAALLTATMILLFLGSWRSTLIVTLTIPLSMLVSVIILSALGHTMNVMTLGGLALAVGILVDDATVEIENIHRHMSMGKSLQQSILDGAKQIAVPTFVSTLTISIVFVSVFFLDGPARFMFVPLGEAVAFAMLASYMLSRTLIPVLVKYLLVAESHVHLETAKMSEKGLAYKHPTSIFTRFHLAFERGFEAVAHFYMNILHVALHHRRFALSVFGLLIVSALIVMPFVGRDYFPAVDAGQLRLHVRLPAGTRIEETERAFAQVEEEIRSIIPSEEIELILDNIGVPSEKFNLAFGDSATTSSSDGEIVVSLAHDRSAPSSSYMKQLRKSLKNRFPDYEFYFQSADIVSQTLNFGLAAPFDIRFVGYDRDNNYKLAREVQSKLRFIPGLVDVHLHQIVDAPDLHFDVDRTRAAELGVNQRDIANNLLVSLSGSWQVTPNYWVDPALGIPYLVSVQTPPRMIDSMETLGSIPLAGAEDAPPQLLANVANTTRRTAPSVVNHSNIQPVFDLYVNIQGRDLGAALEDINEVLGEYRSRLSPGNQIVVEGQADSMNSAFTRLGLGIAFAAVIVYLLMVVNFQSWTDPFVIIMALPGAFVGIVWMLFVTQTTFSIPSLIGSIMCVGVVTANSILIVTFANEERRRGLNAMAAALSAGRTRLRPVIMTAGAMILGMLPMAIGADEGGEQNAPLGRAVIGGLLAATMATLFFVPVVYSILRRKDRPVSDDEIDDESELASSELSD